MGIIGLRFNLIIRKLYLFFLIISNEEFNRIELSAKGCAYYVEHLLKQKGQPAIIKLFVPWIHVRNEQLVDRLIEEALQSLNGNKN
jgi:hypothetical protein